MLRRTSNRLLVLPEGKSYLVCYVPRPHRVQTGIRDLRAIIGKTQREFALSIGISPIALNRIENGTLALSRRVDRKIFFETGIDPRCRLSRKLRTLRTLWGKRYTKEFYKEWKDNFPKQDEENAKVAAGNLSSPTQILLRASVVGSKKRMWLVYNEIGETLDRCRVDFNLERPIDAILAKQRPPVKWEDLLKIPRGWPFWKRKEATAKRKRRSASVRRRKA